MTFQVDLAQTGDSITVFGIVETGAMPPSLASRLLSNVIAPARFETLQALHMRTGIAYSTIHQWSKDKSQPRWEQVQRIAEVLGVDPFALLDDPATRGTMPLRHHPDWSSARARAEARFPGKLPPSAYELAGDTAARTWPAHLDEVSVFDLASFWYRNASDERLSGAETAIARAEMVDDERH